METTRKCFAATGAEKGHSRHFVVQFRRNEFGLNISLFGDPLN